MKIAITGHTDGIGKAIADACEAEGHEIVGFSRSTGYHLFQDMEGVIADAEDCDVFVNNRYEYCKPQQIELLYQMFELWRGQDKRIINISSRAGSYTAQGKIDRYAIHKHALDKACEQLNILPDMRPRVTNIKPGYVDTNSVTHVLNQPKLKPEDVAKAVMWVLNQPRMIHIAAISMSHMKFG